MEEDQKHVEPTHREHLATGGAVEPLVRESIQNSLDATVEGMSTKVGFTLGTVSEDARRYFNDLRPHLEAIKKSLPDGVPRENDPIRFLAIEDFNTRGLEGDPLLRKAILPNGAKNHFFRFWHSVGQSAGDFKRRGSWGVGKVVFSNASRIRTFFGLTRRVGDASSLLMGEAGLTIHTLPGSDDVCDWYGYYAFHESRNNHFVPLPVRDEGEISRFSQAFSVDRSSSGLSIVVPYVREEVTFDDLAKVVIGQYFLPILSGRLEVIVREGDRVLSIARSSIEAAIDSLEWDQQGISSRSEVRSLIELTNWQISLSREQYVKAAVVGGGGNYLFGRESFTDEQVRELSAAYAAGSRVAVMVPISVTSKEGVVSVEEVRVVLQHQEALRKGNVPHIRSGIHITKMRDQSGPAVRGILVVGSDAEPQGDLDKLLQASEGPSHINWELRGEGYDKAKSLFQYANRAIGLMRHLVRGIVDMLSTAPDERDTRTLSFLFPDTEQSSSGTGAGGAGDRRPVPAPEPDLVVPPPGVLEGVVTWYSLSERRKIPVEFAEVRVIQGSDELRIATTDSSGRFRFDNLPVGDYRIDAQKVDVGTASREISMTSDCGISVELVLRPAPVERLFTRVVLEDGFVIQGNERYSGQLHPIRVSLAYAAWGGKSHNAADFTLQEEDSLTVSFDGVVEQDRSEIVRSPNALQFTPATNSFRLEVRGFDSNRALYVDVRVISNSPVEEAEVNE